MAVSALQSILQSCKNLPEKIGCKHMPAGDIRTCSHCQTNLRETMAFLLQQVKSSQIDKLPGELKAKVVAALVQDALVAQPN